MINKFIHQQLSQHTILPCPSLPYVSLPYVSFFLEQFYILEAVALRAALFGEHPLWKVGVGEDEVLLMVEERREECCFSAIFLPTLLLPATPFLAGPLLSHLAFRPKSLSRTLHSLASSFNPS